MADGKKSVLVYIDWIMIFEELEDDEAGRLIKHFFRYVNDQHPEPPDRITKLVFEPIKQSLKRDLVKYETIRTKNKENAEKRWQQKNATASYRIEIDAKNADSDIDSVSDSVIDSDTIKFNFKKSLLGLGISETVCSDWLKVRSKKKAANTETAFNSIKIEIEKSPKSPEESIKIAVENSWSGFKAIWIENLIKTNGSKENFRTDPKKYSIAGTVESINASTYEQPYDPRFDFGPIEEISGSPGIQ